MADPSGTTHPELFWDKVKTQVEIAEWWHVAPGTVTKLAIDLEKCQAAGIDPFDFS